MSFASNNIICFVSNIPAVRRYGGGGRQQQGESYEMDKKEFYYNFITDDFIHRPLLTAVSDSK